MNIHRVSFWCGVNRLRFSNYYKMGPSRACSSSNSPPHFSICLRNLDVALARRFPVLNLSLILIMKCSLPSRLKTGDIFLAHFLDSFNFIPAAWMGRTTSMISKRLTKNKISAVRRMPTLVPIVGPPSKLVTSARLRSSTQRMMGKALLTSAFALLILSL